MYPDTTKRYGGKSSLRHPDTKWLHRQKNGLPLNLRLKTEVCANGLYHSENSQ